MPNSIPISWLYILIVCIKVSSSFTFFANSLMSFIISASFSYQLRLIVFHWSLNVSKSPKVFITLLHILADLNNAVVWMVSILPLISNFSCLSFKLSGTFPSALTTIGITVILIFHSFFSFAAKSKYLFFFSLSFIFPSVVRLYGKNTLDGKFFTSS